MYTGESSVSGSSVNHNDVSYAYSDKKADSGKFQSLMEILKSSPGGKPTSTITSWA